MRYLNRPQTKRCDATITLNDRSEAQCQRFKLAGSPYCAQHTRLIYGARLSDATRAGLWKAAQ